MPSETFLLEILLRGLTLGAMFALAAGLWRAGGRVRTAAVLIALGVCGYTVAMCGPLREALGPVSLVATVFSYGIAGYVWLFVLAVFEDRGLDPWRVVAVAALTALGLFTLSRVGSPGFEALSLVRDAASVGFALHALTIVLSSWRGDLVEARRRLRGPFFAAVALFVVGQTAIDALVRNGAVLAWRDIANAGILALLSSLAAAVFLEGRAGLLGAAVRPAPPLRSDQDLPRLLEAMDGRELWRTERLSFSALAEAAGLPEHRLRRVIHDQLGFRHFAGFVNSRRIEAAKAALADPAQADVTVAALAYDLGFGSLGPFNRAFKEQVGVTPRQWRERRQASQESLAESSKAA